MGDPETQPILFRMEGDLAETLLHLHNNELHKAHIEWRPDPAICVVLASRGYPGAYEKGKLISGLAELDALPDVKAFYAGTATDAAGNTVTSGGRVLGITASGKTLTACRDKAYEAIEKIHFDGMSFRKDIGMKGIKRQTRQS
jgi:phosphoribosylamine--glycine ligase